jgi:DNA primase
MKNFSETVRDSADIVRVISDYVDLKAAGSSRFKGLCPFHSEKTPSFNVDREKQFFHCFGCNAGGDVFEFVKLAEQVSFPESVRIVAEKCGVPLPADGAGSDPRAEEKKRLLDLYERASEFFQKALGGGEAAPARQILEKRKIHPDFVRRFQIGYAPSSGLLNAVRPSSDPSSTGLFQKNENGDVYDRFRRRLMFPIWNERGKTIAFGGRALGDAQPKYLNSPESPLYSKSYVLYGLHLAREAVRKAGRIVVVEGYFDCLGLHQHGIENVVASCGTSLTAQQVTLMNRYAPEVVMNYDPDAAGQNAMRRSIDLLLDKGLRVRILKLPGSLDPDDFVRAEGAEVYRRLLDGAPYFWQYLISDAAGRLDLDQPEMKATAVREVMDHVIKIQDTVEKLEVARAVAEKFKLPEHVILKGLNLQGRRPDVQPIRRTDAPKESRRLDNAERQLIQALTQDHSIARTLEKYLAEDFWEQAWSRPFLERYIREPENLDGALAAIENEELAGEIRAVLFESVGAMTLQHAFASVHRLWDAFLVKQEREIQKDLKQYGSQGAPNELLAKLDRIIKERNHIAETLKKAG